MPTFAFTPPEALSQHITYQQTTDGAIHLFRVTNDDRQSVDTWFEAVRKLSLSASQVCCALHDFTAIRTGATPHARSRLFELMVLRRDVPIYAGALVTRSLTAQFAALFARVASRDNHSGRVFYDEQEALTWLHSMYRKHVPES